MKYLPKVAMVVLLGGVILIGWGSYFLYPWQVAVIRRMNGPRHLVTQTGWHWHWPLLESIHRLDRRRQIYVSPPIPWTGSGKSKVLARFLVSWRISDPERYEQQAGSGASAEARILAELKVALKTSGRPAPKASGPVFLPSIRLDSLDAALSPDGIRISRLQCTGLRWTARQTAIREEREVGKWQIALIRLKRTLREKLARIRATYEKRRMVDRLREAVRVGRILAMGLSKVTSIEAPARRTDPGFYDFLVQYENEREAMKSGNKNPRTVAVQPAVPVKTPPSGRSGAILGINPKKVDGSG
jgi:hypothetical protein